MVLITRSFSCAYKPVTNFLTHFPLTHITAFKTYTTKPLNHFLNVTTQYVYSFTSECVNSLPGSAQGLNFIIENLHRQFNNSEPELKDWWTIRSVACGTHQLDDRHSGGRWMIVADKLLTHLTLFESRNSTVKTRRSEQWVQETRTHTAVQIYR